MSAYKMDGRLVVFACVYFIGSRGTLVESRCRNYDRTTDNLREVIIGKCETFQQIINQDIFCKHGFRNCTDIWEKFSSAFLYKPLCNVSESGYEGYINLTDHPVPRDKGLLWENVYEFVVGYTNHGQKFYALTDTLSGYIGNGPKWCSDPNQPNGMASTGTQCPGWDASPDCSMSASRGFWIAVSKRFAEKCSGHVYVMLNASTVPIYANNTSKCDDASLQILADQVKAKSFAYDCIENPRDIANNLCLHDPSLGLCSKMSTDSAAEPPPMASLLLISLVFILGHF